jgi:1-aminocyclopropane-1-carboxylate deaminase/D-cysteine desulfhydrase-like pyridoxal-dependent ACC family enzyme
MIVLLIASQDLREAAFGLWKDGVLREEHKAVIPPEQLLANLNQCLQNWKTKMEDIDAVAVVTGPGSFTSARLSVTLANSIAFVRGVPVIELPNPARETLVQLVARLNSLLALAKPDVYAKPLYDRPPHITFPSAHLG